MDYLNIRELYHHGIKGQKWGVRKYQNEDGTLTTEGKERYSSPKEARKKVIVGGLKGAGLGAAAGFGTVTAAGLVSSGMTIVPLLVASLTIGNKKTAGIGIGAGLRSLENIEKSNSFLDKLNKAYPYILGASIAAGTGIGIATAVKKKKENRTKTKEIKRILLICRARN